MGVVHWLSRCIPGLSTVLLLVLLECALQILQSGLISFIYPAFLVKHRPVVAQAIFIAYSLFLHILAFVFPLRLCYAAWTATAQIRQAHDPSLALNQINIGEKRSITSIADNQDAQTEYDGRTIMAIILPSYKEDIATLVETLSVLGSHVLARSSYDVYLAMEERDPNGEATARQLISRFQHAFYRISHTVHPAGIPDEAPGKSSNESWAAKEIERHYAQYPASKDVLVTVMDSDTHLLSQYFVEVYSRHMRNRQQEKNSGMTLYMPPIIFDRNSHKVPRMVRVADLMWGNAGLSCYDGIPSSMTIAIPTSVYTLPLSVVRSVNGWDTGAGAIGEDMHMMLKCYFATDGLLRVETVCSPASQCNVSTDLRGFRGWVANHRARYAQALRHMWGSLDTGFAVRKWWDLGNSPKLADMSPLIGMADAKPSPIRRTRKLSHTGSCLKLSQHSSISSRPRRFSWRTTVLFLRMFEAHFLPIHLFIILIASALYQGLRHPISQCQYLTLALEVEGWLRGLGFAAMTMYFFIFYEELHHVCVSAREREMKKAGLYDDMAEDFTYRGRWKLSSILDYVIFPIAGTLYGGIPLLQATFSHFRTEHLVYLVSAKPLRAVADAVEAVEEGISGARQAMRTV